MTITRVLIVDDAEADRSHLKTIVTAAGYLVRTASSGRDGLAQAVNEHPDLIFLDILMPDMDGFSLCRGLRANDATRAIPVVIVSSKNQKADRIWALEQGAAGYVTKPYTPEEILEQIRRL